MTGFDSSRVAAAATRFKAFFDELRGAFVERGDVLAQIALALLAKEHVLIAGPPGTAKSGIASAVLRRIVCEDSGEPSFYARQITESTVQTDLIGPIDFKNLTESGRTTHFTDEGMLGSVHAFLDEVFDGRDMLLRSALGVLQERELKQGSTITRGRIECALMTSNRYISDVLDQSRDTMLAFVDRIAFIGFVPRGFADPASLSTVLQRNVGGSGRPGLDALLTIQDLDVLQAAVEDVYIAPEICESLAELLSSLDAELAAATRADPAFVPTRYISTRTAVRCGQLLRAVCLLDRIFRMPAREPEVLPRDLEFLRLHLLLSGPSPEQTAKLLEREVDPTERRQLSIMRTEREIFEACLRKLTPVTRQKPRPRPSAQPAENEAGDAAVAPTSSAAEAAPVPVTAVAPELQVLAKLEQELELAHLASDAASALTVAKAASLLAREGLPNAGRARVVVERATQAAMLIGLTATLEASAGSEPLLAAVRGVVRLAESLEDGTASMHPTARWMHDRALELIGEAALHAGGSEARLLVMAAAGNAVDPMDHTRDRLTLLGELSSLRAALLARVASRGAEPDEQSWARAIDNAEAMLAAWWSRSFAMAMKHAITSAGSLAPVLGALKPELARLAEVDGKLSLLAGRPTSVKRRVAGARIEDLVKDALASARADERGALVAHIRELLGVLGEHGLQGAIPPASWLGWTTSSLLAAEAEADRSGESEAAILAEAPSLGGYRRLRARGQRTSVACVIAEVALLVAPHASERTNEPASPAAAAAALIGELGDATRGELARADLGRIERALSYLESWFARLEPESSEAVVASGFYQLAWDEAALARFAMEARLLAELLPGVKEETARLRSRIDALSEKAHARGIGILEHASEEAWRQGPVA